MPKASATRPLAALVAYARNSRTHSDAQVGKLERAMRRFGWTIPVLIDEAGEIIAGHARVMAAERIYAAGDTIKGLDGKPLRKGHVPVLVAEGWSAAQKRAYVIADNRLAEDAGWDLDVLREELEAIADDFDAIDLGFDDDELELGDAGDPDPIGPVPEGAYTEQFGVVVVCKGEADQKAVYERLRDEGLQVRVVKV